MGTQYRTVIFYHSPEQQAVANASKVELESAHEYRRPIATQIVPAGPFYVPRSTTSNTWRSAA